MKNTASRKIAVWCIIEIEGTGNLVAFIKERDKLKQY